MKKLHCVQFNRRLNMFMSIYLGAKENYYFYEYFIQKWSFFLCFMNRLLAKVCNVKFH